MFIVYLKSSRIRNFPAKAQPTIWTNLPSHITSSKVNNRRNNFIGWKESFLTTPRTILSGRLLEPFYSCGELLQHTGEDFLKTFTEEFVHSLRTHSSWTSAAACRLEPEIAIKAYQAVVCGNPEWAPTWERFWHWKKTLQSLPFFICLCLLCCVKVCYTHILNHKFTGVWKLRALQSVVCLIPKPKCITTAGAPYIMHPKFIVYLEQKNTETRSTRQEANFTI